MTDKTVELSDLNGKIIASISGLDKGSDEVYIITTCGDNYRFMHHQDCCECVDLNDFEADTDDFSHALVLSAEEVDGEGVADQEGESCTWTFYKIETDKGGLWMRWLGESNGYYSESVDFERLEK